MTRIKSWIAQGKYVSFRTGKPMILVMSDKGATVLEPLYRNKK